MKPANLSGGQLTQLDRGSLPPEDCGGLPLLTRSPASHSLPAQARGASHAPLKPLPVLSADAPCPLQTTDGRKPSQSVRE